MAETFNYDVFISHSAKDKPAVRELARRLRKDGLRVWLDDWEIKPGDSIPLKIEQGLEQSRTLVLMISAYPSASEWMTFERYAVMFRDPTNQKRRFIPVKLDDASENDHTEPIACSACRLPAYHPKYHCFARANRITNQRLRASISATHCPLNPKIEDALRTQDCRRPAFIFNLEGALCMIWIRQTHRNVKERL